MSDPTPTTEEVRTPKTFTVRACFVKGHSFPLTTEVEERYEEFDRWLAEVIREAKWVGWEEGWDARVNAETITPTEKPYRQGETDETKHMV